ncbi:anthranilate synthase component I [Kocuria coralli]|uniref:Anthranilate synthase component 1 n=1 Tax=Kocuria coralli TaxID=1461025 RepID=A0A5J5KZM6_9MICC|nr:anthranilate synthase component I [Kocuria coralli]KAA9395013.1 anthranilate synthase component I [Kocuria coralli]
MEQLGTITPSLEEFRQLAASHRVVPVRTTVLADAMTPIGIYRTLVMRPDGTAPAGTFLLESAAQGIWSRWSWVGVSSRATLTSKADEAHWIGQPPAGVPTEGSPVDVLQATMELLHTSRFTDAPPLTSGMVGFVGWEAVRHWERLPNPPEDDLRIPMLAMNLVSDMAVHDNQNGTVTLVANAINTDGTDERVDEAYADAVERVHAMLEKLSSPAGQVSVLRDTGRGDADGTGDLEAVVDQSWDRQIFIDSINEAKQAIVDGEIFQVVISRRFETPCEAGALDVYRTLRRINPSPYMYLYSFEDATGRDYQVVGSSPEALVTVTDREVVTHPIAGSRPRGATPAEDLVMEKDLLADEKERAEHLMLVDLSRNDLSKVCVPGSVDVTEFMEVERFSHIMHLCSNVVGQMRRGTSAYDVLAATFPAGTLSGAPKPRALQLLDEYEPFRRAIYGGVVGYMDFAGDMDMAIAIRTALLVDGKAYVQAGGGIVADSVPETEATESLNKATAPMRAALTATRLRGLEKGERL